MQRYQDGFKINSQATLNWEGSKSKLICKDLPGIISKRVVSGSRVHGCVFRDGGEGGIESYLS